ncbi:hypothetical protein Cantr_05329 [Candida viswanathii]|uniref:Globin domain-containing protein n=1 Tax=Candida viswanathii TaxID=5486 RepID=A0A367XS39_9ASCO|nr:hypothetical protein Cantr_05329 [Candida viswanathii]
MMFRFSTDATALPTNRNSKFIRSSSTSSSLTQSPLNTFSNAAGQTSSPTSTTASKRIPSPLINKYKSNQSIITDTDSLSSSISNVTNSNSTIATSVANSPPNHAKSSLLANDADHSMESTAPNDDASTVFDHSAQVPPRRAPSLHSGHFPHQDESIYELIRLDTRVSLESYYVEQGQEQYKVKLTLNERQIELLRYTWNKMLLEESSSSENMPGAFTTTPVNRKSPKKKTNTKIESSTIASSLFCRQFYFNLLSKDPELEKLFPSIKHQAVSFAGILTFTISQLENLSNLDEFLLKLGKLHARILNIEAPQFELMGEALIQTFQERFGKKFTKELENLWIKLYLYLANSLLQYGIDPVLKLSRYESHGSFMSSTTSVDLANGETSILRDDLSSLEPSQMSKTSSNLTLPKPAPQPMVSTHNLQETTIPELKPGFKKKMTTRMKKAKGNNCVIM